ncbi:C2H2-type domain-containing protein [Plasmodiophora brassicae]|uniref:Uncharacterized protein n=1 Tax=Plasmodiophora brassicae TaxID=37360 RepID=A0A0G4IVP2_PLABS|nr:hypothetical protein PBRA_001281 [Plasmodiophora brassicae]
MPVIGHRFLRLVCQSCQTTLFKYAHRGDGGLPRRLRTSRIVDDFTKGSGDCHECGERFARPMIYKSELSWHLVGKGASFDDAIDDLQP